MIAEQVYKSAKVQRVNDFRGDGLGIQLLLKPGCSIDGRPVEQVYAGSWNEAARLLKSIDSKPTQAIDQLARMYSGLPVRM